LGRNAGTAGNAVIAENVNPVAATVPVMPLAFQAKRWSEGICLADLRTESPPLAIAHERTVRANDPEATATYCLPEPVASFEFSGWARHSYRLDSRRYRGIAFAL
jgi:hypothetical protein